MKVPVQKYSKIVCPKSGPEICKIGNNFLLGPFGENSFGVSYLIFISVRCTKKYVYRRSKWKVIPKFYKQNFCQHWSFQIFNLKKKYKGTILGPTPCHAVHWIYLYIIDGVAYVCVWFRHKVLRIGLACAGCRPALGWWHSMVFVE